jgi:HAD superfamily hydrolase (TIGR01509 family)
VTAPPLLPLLPLLPAPPDPPLDAPPSPAVPPLPELPQLATSAANAAAINPHSRMEKSLSRPELVRDVDLLCLDAGNTVVFLDHARLAGIAVGVGLGDAAGARVTAEALVRAEGAAKIALEEGRALAPAWSRDGVAGASGWAAYVATMLHHAGVPDDRIVPVLDAAWQSHRDFNLWSLVPPGLAAALGRARAAGVRIAVVSNSEGQLDALLVALGIRDAFDLVVDSAVAGFEKPDPRIFEVALRRFGVPASRALHLGDNYATDVLGARAAGVRVALVDPFEHLAGRHPDVPRVAGAREVADALAAAGRGVDNARRPVA